MNWTGEHRAFIVETFFKSNESVTARSLDLNPCDFFLWRHLKSKVLNHCSRSIEELKRAIRLKIAAISQEMIHRVMDSFHERLQQYVDNDGKHLTDLIYKTE